jgi:hypothetical protein
MKRVYALLCVLGLALPYYFFIPFVTANGLHVSLLARQLFANQVSAFFGVDVIVSSLVLWAFIFHETRRRRIKYWWLCILASLVVGVSLGLPFFLLLREVARDKEKHG